MEAFAKDCLIIDELCVEAQIGVLTWEQAAKQRLMVSLIAYTDMRAAGMSDVLEESIDYKAISDLIENVASSHQFQLLESFAHECAKQLMQFHLIAQVEVFVYKPQIIPNAKRVGIKIVRTRDDFADLEMASNQANESGL